MIHYAQLHALYHWEGGDTPGGEGSTQISIQGWGLRNELFLLILECINMHLRCQIVSLR